VTGCEDCRRRDEAARADAARRFWPGQAVEKHTGDYTATGVVVAAFLTSKGRERYVVEHDGGILHIYSASNLRSAPGRWARPSSDFAPPP